LKPNEFTYFPLGDSSFLIKVGNEISVECHKLIKALVLAINQEKIKGVSELIPAYNELLLIYNPLEINYTKLIDTLKDIEKKLNPDNLPPSTIIHIPVCYETEFAPDLEIVAEKNNLTKNEVIKLHSSIEYLVYMLGFTPGFCYLGGMDARIATQRKESPRKIVEAGSVGIAGSQTGIYPIDSPGGWQIIGKTPINLFDTEREQPFLIEAGNYIKFDSITKTEFDQISDLIKSGNYFIRKESKHG
jgi:inhibitor of KinA